MATLRQRLVKTGGRLIKHARYFWLLLAESHLNAAPVWRHAKEDRNAAVAGGVTVMVVSFFKFGGQEAANGQVSL
jgi:hypothetical protein